MKFRFLFLCFLLIPAILLSQKETAYWHFGESAGLHFTDGGVESISTSRIETSEGSASISDQNGNLLFYTDGTRVFDRTNQGMQNGGQLKGNASSTQSAMIIPRPSSPGRYFLFTVDKPDYSNYPNDPIEGVNYSEIDMSLNNGLGGIIPDKKNIHLVTYDPSDPLQNEFKSSEKISAVVGGDCISYWVVTQFVNKFFAFKVTSEGVNPNPVVSITPNNVRPILDENDVNVTAPGYMKISPDGTKLAIAFSATALGSPRSGGGKSNGRAFLYDFDDETGKVSNQKLIIDNTFPYGVEFSAESEKLYLTLNDYNNNGVLQESVLMQFDVTESDVAGTGSVIHTSSNVAGALQLALDGRIYRAGYPVFIESHQKLSVIRNPNEDAGNVTYSHNSITIESGFLRLGLPPFVQSLFNSNFDVEGLCLGSKTRFEITGQKNYDSVEWEFGDGTVSTEESPTHQYTSPGTYVVSLTKINNGIPMNPACEEVTIVKLPDLDETFTLNQCDVGDSDPTDGITTFNLQEIAASLGGSENPLQLYFYKTESDAMADFNNQNSLDNIYQNSVPDEKLIVKALAFNSDCYSLTSINLKTTSTKTLSPSPVTGCSSDNGDAEFSRPTIEQSIKEELTLPDDVELDFFTSEDDAVFGRNPLPEFFNTSASRIFIKARQNGECYGFGSVDLEVNSLPQVQNNFSLQACSSEFPITIGNDISLPNSSNFNFQWSTGATAKEITINSPGVYRLEITDPNIGCGQFIEYTIEETAAPSISEVIIINEGRDNTIEVQLESNENLNPSFSLDSETGPYQNSPIFRNVPGGNHTVYVKDDNACDLVKRDLALYGFPNYFTPNNDGYNDLWRPFDIPDPGYKLKRIYIFDRYGKLLVELPANTKGWDGNFNGNPMPSDDYWFEVQLENGEVFKNHFSLIRKN